MTRRPQAIPVIVANWKMQLGVQESQQRMLDIKIRMKTIHGRYQLVVCPSYLAIPGAKKIFRGSSIKLGAQDVGWDERGAYTGEVSPLSLGEMGVEYVIIGHSERRQLQGETDEMIGRKIISAYGHNLIPILCVGETAHERNERRHENVIRQQLSRALRTAPPPTGQGRLYVAYEPIWAVGTGEPASPDDALSMLRVIRQTLIDLYSLTQVDQSFRILYGGSVVAENVSEYVSTDAYHGTLVGGASLEVDRLATLVTNITDHFS